jgi:hypothetical protein
VWKAVELLFDLFTKAHSYLHISQRTYRISSVLLLHYTSRFYIVNAFRRRFLLTVQSYCPLYLASDFIALHVPYHLVSVWQNTKIVQPQAYLIFRTARWYSQHSCSSSAKWYICFLHWQVRFTAHLPVFRASVSAYLDTSSPDSLENSNSFHAPRRKQRKCWRRLFLGYCVVWYSRSLLTFQR